MRDLSQWTIYAAAALADRALVDSAYVDGGQLDTYMGELFAADYLATYYGCYGGWAAMLPTERAAVVEAVCDRAARILRDWTERTAELV
jgi:hypothetical protein